MNMGDNHIRQRIYCHRGQWSVKTEQNSFKALRDASDNGFGLETDVRDSHEKLVISHDAFLPPLLNLSEIASLNSPIALNVKSDGLLRHGRELISKIIEAPRSFVFDGSIPEMLQYKRIGANHALRLSEYETELPWLSGFIWLDAFESDWWLRSDILQQLSEKQFVVVVSPELHSREYRGVWDAVTSEISKGNPNVGICTDKPIDFLRMVQ